MKVIIRRGISYQIVEEDLSKKYSIRFPYMGIYNFMDSIGIDSNGRIILIMESSTSGYGANFVLMSIDDIIREVENFKVSLSMSKSKRSSDMMCESIKYYQCVLGLMKPYQRNITIDNLIDPPIDTLWLAC